MQFRYITAAVTTSIQVTTFTKVIIFNCFTDFFALGFSCYDWFIDNQVGGQITSIALRCELIAS